jgi:nicotinamidase/pyrazinamidase
MRPADEAFVVIDVQNDFCPGGALAVAEGDAIVPGINALMEEFAAVVLTQDWHPAGHSSFASSHQARAPYDVVEMSYGPQVLWPDHCVQGTPGAAFHPGLDVTRADLVIRNDHRTSTGLAGYLRERGIARVTLVGLATDFCVNYSAVDGARLGFEVTVHEGLTRAIDLQGSLAAARGAWTEAGVKVA